MQKNLWKGVFSKVFFCTKIKINQFCKFFSEKNHLLWQKFRIPRNISTSLKSLPKKGLPKILNKKMQKKIFEKIFQKKMFEKKIFEKNVLKNFFPRNFWLKILNQIEIFLRIHNFSHKLWFLAEKNLKILIFFIFVQKNTFEKTPFRRFFFARRILEKF